MIKAAARCLLWTRLRYLKRRSAKALVFPKHPACKFGCAIFRRKVSGAAPDSQLPLSENGPTLRIVMYQRARRNQRLESRSVRSPGKIHILAVHEEILVKAPDRFVERPSDEQDASTAPGGVQCGRIVLLGMLVGEKPSFNQPRFRLTFCCLNELKDATRMQHRIGIDANVPVTIGSGERLPHQTIVGDGEADIRSRPPIVKGLPRGFELASEAIGA